MQEEEFIKNIRDIKFTELLEKNIFYRDDYGRLCFDLILLKELEPEYHEKFISNTNNFLNGLKKECYNILGIKSFKIVNFTQLKPISELRVNDLNTLCLANGMISKVTKVLAYIEESKWECNACGAIISVEKDKKPNGCSCRNKKNFTLISNKLRDLQEIEIEEPQDELEGKQPQKIRVRLFDELTDNKFSGIIQPGNKISILGVAERLDNYKKEEETIFEYRLLALDITPLDEQFSEDNISKEDEELIIDISQNNPLQSLCESLAPSIYGNEEIKKSIILQMVGGVKKIKSGNVSSRERIHILLCGEPGVAKTFLGKCVKERMPKSYYVSGDSTTKAGLTAIVERDPLLGNWCLKVGSLCKANNSIIIIDEMDKLSDEDRQSLHTPMESGEIVVNKADIHCYSEDTEVLTEKGWKKYNQVKDLKIAQYNYETNNMEFVNHTGLSLFDYDGKMYHFKNKRNDILVTPNHRMFLRPSYSKGKYKIVIAENIKHNRFNFINSATINSKIKTNFFVLDGTTLNIKRKHEKYLNQKKDKKIPMDLWLEFLGYFLSEGGLSYSPIKGEKKYYTTIGQNVGKNQKKIEKCLKKIENYGLKFCRIVEKRKGKINHIRYSIGNKQLWDYLFKNCLYKNNKAKKYPKYHKKIPMFVFNLNKEEIKVIFDAMMLGDGHIKNGEPKSYSSTSEDLIDGFQIISLMLGFSAKKNKRKGSMRNGYYENGIYTISLTKKNEPRVYLSNINKVNYKGKVFCFSVPSGIFFTRRNGYVSIQGNTVLTANCSILGIANPKKGIFDLESPLTSQIDIPPPLMSRFDLIFVMKDSVNKESDYSIVDIIYKNEKEEPIIPIGLFRRYISYSKKFRPKLGNKFLEPLKEFYHEIRKKSVMENSKLKGMPITPRHLEGLIRLSEASAKIRLSEKVEKEDLDIAKKIFIESLFKLGLDKESGVIDLARIGVGKTLNKKQKGRLIIQILFKELEGNNFSYIYPNKLKEKCIESGISSLDYDELIFELNKEGEIIKSGGGWIIPK